MKKAKQLILLFVCVLLLSGCMKSRISMDIGKDKSMVFTYEVLISDQLRGGDETEDKEQLEALEKKGFTINPKTENGYSGYVISKKYSNIDDVSKNNGDLVDLSELLDSEFDDTKIFKVEESFLKNTYTAKFKVSTEMDQGNENFEPISDNEEEDLTIVEDEEIVTTENDETGEVLEPVENDEVVTTEQTTTGEEDTTGSSAFDGNMDFLSLTSEMETSYTVKLPYGSDSNNATTVSEDGKTLTWNLIKENNKNIEYTFSIYNIKNIAIIAGGALLLIIIIIILIAKKAKKKPATSETLIHTDYDSSIVGQINETTNEVNEIPQGNANHEIAANAAEVQNAQVQEAPIAADAPTVASSIDEATANMVAPELSSVAPQAPEIESTPAPVQEAPQMAGPAPMETPAMPVGPEVQTPTMASPDAQTPTMSASVPDLNQTINQVPQTPQEVPFSAPSENVSATPVVNGGLDVPNMVAFSDMNNQNNIQ